jgi:hypothetical protein
MCNCGVLCKLPEITCALGKYPRNLAHFNINFRGGFCESENNFLLQFTSNFCTKYVERCRTKFHPKIQTDSYGVNVGIYF